MSKHHVIIGGGPAATSALETIRQLEQVESRITLLCDEPAHSRMVLPYWLSGQIPRDRIMTGDAAYFRELGVEARIGTRVERIDPHGKRVHLSDGTDLGFDDLFIATGSSAQESLMPGTGLPGVQPLWTLAQAEALLAATKRLERPRVALVGAGFIGCIVLNAMYKRGWQLTVIEREAHVLPRMLDSGAARLIEHWLASQGVSVYTGVTVKEIVPQNRGAKRIELGNGVQAEVDSVILATGIRPNLGCLRDSGIHVDRGVLVNDRLQTNFSFIYAGGDIAQGPVLYGNADAVHAIQPTAVDHGRVAGANLAGQDVRYPGSLLMNVLELCGLQCASFGNPLDSAAEAMTISDRHTYRRLLWTGDQITGAIFTGLANDLGMLTDVGMVKGIMQTRTPLGDWKSFLAENPFDIRRPYVANRVGLKLMETTLLGSPARPRQYQFSGTRPRPPTGPAHAVFMGNRAG
jgi:NAD(P)H-nitrite reductase large subunit